MNKFVNGYAKKVFNDKEGFINEKGIPIGKGIIYDWVEDFDENGLAPVQLYKKWGFINTKGIPIGKGIIYDGVNSYTWVDNLIIVRLKNKYGFIDTTGKEIGKGIIYDWVEDFDEKGQAYVELKGECFYINKNGDIAITRMVV